MGTSSGKLLFLDPVFVEKIWGGRKLETEFGYEIPDGPIGECWAISAHPHGDCRVAEGPFAGTTLSELWDTHRELFGDAFVEHYAATREWEERQFRRHVTDWELARYFEII